MTKNEKMKKTIKRKNVKTNTTILNTKKQKNAEKQKNIKTKKENKKR